MARRIGIFLIVFCFWNEPLWAQIFRGPASSALGGAGVAGISGTEGVFLNPALVPVFHNSSLNAYFRDGSIGPGEHRWAAGLGAIDNGEDVWFPGALHYVRLRETGLVSSPVNGELWHVGLGQRFGEHFSVGVSVYRLAYNVVNDHTSYVQWNGSFGTLFMINPHLGVAYVLNHIANPSSATPRNLRQDLEQVAGVFAALGDLARLRLDISRQEHFNPDHKLAYRVGFESKTSDLFVMRLGYAYDDLKFRHVWTAGVGFDGPRLKANYSFEKNQEGTPGALHSVDLSVPF